MDEPNTAEKVYEEKMRQDLGDIRALQESEPFNRYFLRRLAEKKVKIESSFRNDPPATVDKDEREILRRILAVFDELQAMMTKEEGTIQVEMKRLGDLQ